jgi:hypothetical protein
MGRYIIKELRFLLSFSPHRARKVQCVDGEIFFRRIPSIFFYSFLFYFYFFGRVTNFDFKQIESGQWRNGRSAPVVNFFVRALPCRIFIGCSYEGLLGPLFQKKDALTTVSSCPARLYPKLHALDFFFLQPEKNLEERKNGRTLKSSGN